MKFAIFSAAATIFASAASASPVAIRDSAPSAVVNLIAVNKPVSGEHSTKAIKVPFGKLTHFDVPITGFQVQGVTVANIPGSPKVDESKVVCRRYKDEYGVSPGSALFTKKNEALISTNTVEFGHVLCWIGA